MSANKSGSAKRRWSPLLRAGERLITFYAHDAAECDCAPVTNCSGVPCIPVGHSVDGDRCLICDTTWPAKRHRDDGHGESLALWTERVA